MNLHINGSVLGSFVPSANALQGHPDYEPSVPEQLRDHFSEDSNDSDGVDELPNVDAGCIQEQEYDEIEVSLDQRREGQSLLRLSSKLPDKPALSDALNVVTRFMLINLDSGKVRGFAVPFGSRRGTRATKRSRSERTSTSSTDTEDNDFSGAFDPREEVISSL